MRTILHLTFIFIFITVLLGSWNCAGAKKININNRNLSRRYNGGSISSDSSVKRRHSNRLRIRAQPAQNASPANTAKAEVSNTVQKSASDGKLMDDKSVQANGQPTVTVSDGASPIIVAGIASFGVVCVVVVGIFMVVSKRKRRELTDSIVATSATAWEKQNTFEELKEEEETPQPIGSYTVIDTYVPTLPDELDIQPGDKVTVLVVYDDGWVQGINETRGGVKGVFPQHCVNMKVSFNNKRSSSIGAYTIVDLN
ncbi:10831_t:CDS:2 [Dentiscutata erythropus]|uniref:10831_t:CDS:1 n=1 Tax=Dentiscutata erythropus TaxID=1348616 RepID=A0A9N9F0M1_9GLOM|nr:10831_t:CDS:2 [Dentiscutata erythropus]